MDCLVCREDVIRTGYAVSVKCGHVFHGKCLLQWMETQNSCPVCRVHFLKEHVTALFLSHDLGEDDSYKYEWEDLKPDGINSISRNTHVNTIVLVTTPAPDQQEERSTSNWRSLCIGTILLILFLISLYIILIQ